MTSLLTTVQVSSSCIMKFGSYLVIFVIIMGDDIVAQRGSLENWMSNLPEQLKNMPVVYLAIPGSHDSMTYSITRSSALAPDAEPVLYRLFPLFRGSIMRWTITQTLDPVEQMKIGIRYFDMRVATKVNTDKYFFTHGLYADEISKPLTLIKDFVKSHPGEIVIIDFQHFHAFGKDDHQKLLRYLINLYGTMLCPRQMNLETVTLNSMRSLGQQVIIVYRHQSVYSTEEFWQPQMIPSPWPQQEDTSKLFNFLEHLRRHHGIGFIHQAVLTPTPTFIVLRWISSLREKCAYPVMKEVLPKLAEFSAGPPLTMAQMQDKNPVPRSPLNIVIADFVEMNDAIFPKTIIELNYKLIKNFDTVYHGHGLPFLK